MSKMYTKNFSFKELNCPCPTCTDQNGVEQMNLVSMLKFQAVRDILNEPLNVNSAYRCKAHNKAVGGSDSSYHMSGLAMDIKSLGLRFNSDLVRAALKVGLNGIIVYKSFIHLDDRSFAKRILMRGSNV